MNSETAEAISVQTTTALKVTVENLQPEGGGDVTPPATIFHDGSFDTFDVGDPASPAIETIAEEAIAGFASPELTAIAIERGLADSPVIPQLTTLEQSFSESLAAQNGGKGSVAEVDPVELLRTGYAIRPGERGTSTIALDENFDPSSVRYFNFASMFFPSNDAFIGNDDPTSIEVFDEEGNFTRADFVVTGNQVYDAGTEVNDESTSNLPYKIANVGNGTVENGVIRSHPGFLPAGSGGVLDTANIEGANPRVTTFGNIGKSYENADFLAPGSEEVARFSIDLVTTQTIDGTSSHDILTGTNDSEDIISGSSGDDELSSLGGDDTLDGGDGRDVIIGDNGFDFLTGGTGRDILVGGNDDDVLGGGEEVDYLTGSDGKDKFFFQSEGDIDTIADYEDGVDQIIVDIPEIDSVSDLGITQSGTSTILSSESGDFASLLNTVSTNIDAEDFIFAVKEAV
jgi:Ca2+-binding RTX toxin-like protein